MTANSVRMPRIPSLYIFPTTKIHSSFDDVQKFYDALGGMDFFWDKEKLSLRDLTEHRYNLIIGEPGIGKTTLLCKVEEYIRSKNDKTCYVELKNNQSLHLINEFVNEDTGMTKALFLDGLDEVRSDSLDSAFDKIEEAAREEPALSLFITARWSFIKKHAFRFRSEYRYISLSPFTAEETKQYLADYGFSESDINVLLHRVMSFNHNKIILQIPRYLSYFADFLQNKGMTSASEVSRNELFEYFIYKKLELEDKKLNTEKRLLIKRLLEKLALIMEIWQSVTITKDDFMTFLDEVNSGFKMNFIDQISLEILFDKSILKNNADTDTIEFDNPEFQEYLAAKEITRFADPKRATFDLAVNPDIKELYPSWFNTLTFLIDMCPELLGTLIEFSGMKQASKIVDSTFFDFISRINAITFLKELRIQIFQDTFEYHQKMLQWLPAKLASGLAHCYDPSLMVFLKSYAEKTIYTSDTDRFVQQANLSYIMGAILLYQGAMLSSEDRAYWRAKLVEYITEPNKNTVLQRHAVEALGCLGDQTVIEELPPLLNTDEIVVHSFLSACTRLNPDHEKCLQYFIDEVRKGDFYGRYGLFEITEKKSLKHFLEVFISDDDFLRRFLGNSEMFKIEDKKIADHIEHVFDSDIEELCRQAILKCLHYHFVHDAEKSSFVIGLWKLLKRRRADFIETIINTIKNGGDSSLNLYSSHPFFVEVINKDDVDQFIDIMIALGEKHAAVSIMQRIRFSKKERSEEIYKAGKQKLSQEYVEWESRLVRNDRGRELYDEFLHHLEPEPGKYSHQVFRFYNEHLRQIEAYITKSDKLRLETLITETIFRYVDPATCDVTITVQGDGSSSISTSTAVSLFGDALLTAQLAGINVSKFRQKIIAYIPFAWTNQLKAIFEIVKSIRPEEIAPVIEIYKRRSTDLWKYQPSSFINAAKQYHATNAVSILKEFVKESAYDSFCRRTALETVDYLTPDPVFLQEIFALYEESCSKDERELAQVANALLITSHGQGEAIHWRMQKILEGASPFIQPRGVHSVTGIEHELYDRSFAKPLMCLSLPGYESHYITLLEESFGIFENGETYYEYARYIWDIVFSYFDNLKERKAYDPLKQLEMKIIDMQGREGINWVSSRIANLRRSYLSYIGRPTNIAEATKKYNKARDQDNKRINDSQDLLHYIIDAINTDLRKWIDGEGAYELIIGEKVFRAKKQEYETLIQKTIKTQIENILLKRGFQSIDIDREVQLDDGKRVDFLIRYGFVGRIVLEVKLASNKDMRSSKIESTESFRSMKRYMNGYGATYGIFLIIENDPTQGSKVSLIKKVFEKIPETHVLSIDCNPERERKKNN